MDNTGKMIGVSDPFWEKTDYIFVTFAVSGGNIVAYANVTMLKNSIQFSQLINDFFIQVEYTTVILTHTLNNGTRNKTSTDQILHGTFSNPSRITNITFPARQLLDEIGIH